MNICFFFCLDKYWKVIENRRAFFDEIAEKKGFEPLDVNHWYDIALEEILNKEVC